MGLFTSKRQHQPAVNRRDTNATTFESQQTEAHQPTTREHELLANLPSTLRTNSTGIRRTSSSPDVAGARKDNSHSQYRASLKEKAANTIDKTIWPETLALEAGETLPAPKWLPGASSAPQTISKSQEPAEDTQKEELSLSPTSKLLHSLLPEEKNQGMRLWVREFIRQPD
jgi:hypothetical protein